MSFRTNKDDLFVQLSWITAGEYNVDRFEVERSVGGLPFYYLHSVKATNGATNKSYEWVDVKPAPGVSFYRLKMIDMDAVFNYSSTVRVDRGRSPGGILVYPNPFLGRVIKVFMKDQVKGLYVVSVYDNAGKRVYNTTLTMTVLTNTGK